MPSPRPPSASPLEIKLGISACILGREVRWNSGHKLDRFVRDTLGGFVSFVEVCPEVEAGMGVPRPPVRLVELHGKTRMVTTDGAVDHTDAMVALAHARVEALAGQDLSGFIVQKGSPSCGMERVKVYRGTGMPTRDGRGLFTAALMARMPYLPVEEDGRLNDPALRESFVERVFAYRRLRALFDREWTMHELVEFHAAEKLLVLAHDRPTYTALGQLVAGAKRRRPATVAADYQRLMMTGLARVATRGKHTNVLQHLAGYFKKLLDDADKAELHDLIDGYRRGEIPLIVPVTLIRHHVRRHRIDYLARQTYLDPHPRELMLRNHV